MELATLPEMATTPPYLCGTGACTSIGPDVSSIWQNMLTGASGLSVYDDGKSLLALIDIDDEADRLYRIAKQALQECIDSAQWSPDEADTALIFAHGSPDMQYLLAATERFETMGNCRPDAVYRSMNSYVAARLGKEFSIQGPVYSVSAACAGSASAIHLATLLLASGTVTRCLCGGGETISKFTQAAFSGMRSVLTRSASAGATAIQPFGKARSGIALGEGCGWLALGSTPADSLREPVTVTYSQLINVPAAVYGDVLNQADWHRLLDTPILNDCDLVMAHATSTSKGDLAEGKAILHYLPDATVLSSKYHFGHTLSASTVLDVIVAARIIEDNTLLSIGHDYPLDDELSTLQISNATKPATINKAAKISAAFGGSLGVLILEQQTAQLPHNQH